MEIPSSPINKECLFILLSLWQKYNLICLIKYHAFPSSEDVFKYFSYSFMTNM